MHNAKGFFIALNAVIAALLATPAAHATYPNAGGIGTVSTGAAVVGSFSIGANGTSSSYAQNTESARASITTAKSYTPGFREVNAAVQGATRTESAGTAYNTSTGSGSGHALSAGQADTSVNGSLGIQGVTSGLNGGSSGTHTENIIKAARNQGSYVNGQTISGFEAQIHYAKSYAGTPVTAGGYGGSRSAAVELTGSSTGYASGANASAALDKMNAAGIANIGASGYFFGKTDMSSSTSHISAP